jgi:hypothetical protein
MIVKTQLQGIWKLATPFQVDEQIYLNIASFQPTAWREWEAFI